VDGILLPEAIRDGEAYLPLHDDRTEHLVEVELR